MIFYKIAHFGLSLISKTRDLISFHFFLKDAEVLVQPEFEATIRPLTEVSHPRNRRKGKWRLQNSLLPLFILLQLV